jgi:hypothetical protein
MTTPILFKEYIWLVNTIYQARSYGAGKKEIVSQFMITEGRFFCNSRKMIIFANVIQIYGTTN